MTITRRSARFSQVLIAVLALALVLTAVPAVIFGSAPKSYAASANVSTADQLKTALANASVTDINVTQDIQIWAGHDFDSVGANLSLDNQAALTVPAGQTKNLNMNGHKIYCYSHSDSGDCHLLICEQYSDACDAVYEHGGVHYVMIENFGTLNIKGGGQIDGHLAQYGVDSYEQANEQWMAADLAVIKNHGDVTVNAGTTVSISDFAYQVEENNYKSSSVYAMGCAIYSDAGTVNCAGNISVNMHMKSTATGGAMGMNGKGSQTKSLAYGIFAKAGTVNVNGGSIGITNYAGINRSTGEPNNSCSIIAPSIGIYTASSSSVIDNVSITTYVKYEDDDEKNDSGNNCDFSYADSMGVTYTGSAPTIGTGVTIDNSVTRGYWDSGDGDAIEARVAVSQLSAAPVDLFAVNSHGEFEEKSQRMSVSSGTYSYKDENGSTWTCNNGDGLTNGMPNSQTSSTAKIVVVYRYYDTSNNLEAAYTAPADYTTRSVPISLVGVSANHCTGGSFTYTGGGAAKNGYFFELTSIRYWAVGTAQPNWTVANPTAYILKEDANGNLSPVADGVVSAQGGYIYYIYVDYLVYPTDPIRFNVNNPAITSPDNNEAEVYYTGSPAQFGTGTNQIALHVYKTNYVKDRYALPDEIYANDEEITDRFQTLGSGSTGFSISVKNADGSSAGTTLPTNPGVYTVTVTTGSEAAYNASPAVAKNFAAGTFTFTLTIKPREVTITQTAVPEISYGQALSSLTSTALANYFTIDTGVSGLSANGTFTWQSPSSILNAGEYDDLVLTWSDARGYFVAQTLDNVRVKVNKATLTITAKNKTVTYGTDINLTSDDFTFAGLANKANEQENVFNEIKDTLRVDGAYWTNTGFSAAETHTYGLTATGTANYNIVNRTASLTINRSGLILTLPLIEKKYDALATIDITFTADMIVSGLVDTYGTSGVYIDTYVGAPLANGGAVGDTTGSVQIARFTELLKGPKAVNYTVTGVTNASAFPARVSKADPIVDPLALANSTITYDPTKTLSKFSEITGNTTSGVILEIGGGTGKTPGKWIWKSDIKPTVSQRTYVAQFVPNDSNYATVDQTMTVNVQKRTITVGVTMPEISYGDPQPTGTYTFSGFPDGSTEKINVSGSSYTSVNFELSGNVYYSCIYDNEAAAAQNKAAGTYPITITNELESDNYAFVADNSSVLTVNPKTLTLTPVQQNLTYGDVLQNGDLSYNVVGLVAGDEAVTAGINVTYSHSYTSSSPVGTYPVTISVSNESSYPNYAFVLNSGRIVVSKALLTVVAEDINVVYGTVLTSDVYHYDFVGFKGSDDENVVTGRPTFSSTYTPTSPAGSTYQIIIGVNDLSAENYNFVASAETALITVTPAPVFVTAWPTYTVENGKTLADAVRITDGSAVNSANASIAGTFRFNNTETVLPYNIYGNAQDVAATFYPSNSNYQTVVKNVKVTVLPKAISGSPSISGTIMAGETVRLDVTTLDPGSIDNYIQGSIKWYVDGTVVTTGSMNFYLSEDYIGKDLMVEITANESRGYTGVATYRSPSPISETLQVPTLNDLYLPVSYDDVSQNTATFTYDKQSHSLAVSRKNPNIGQVTVKYNGQTSAIDAGTYTVTVDIASSASGIYAPRTGLVVGYLTIEPRPVTVTFSADDKVYDGKTNATIRNFDATNGIITTDDVAVNREQATFTFESANAGDGIPVTMNYAYLEGTARANYVIAQEPIYANIIPKEISSVAVAADQDYSVSNYTVANISFSNPAGILAADKSGVTIGTTTGIVGNNAAGMQYVTYIDYDGVLTGEKAANYSFTASNAAVLQVRINQVRDPARTTPTVINANYSSAQTLASLSGDLPSGWAWDDSTIVPTVRVKTYEATYTPENSSYLTEKMSVRVEISPVEVIITPATAYLTYGDPVPSLGYTVMGFTGSDTVANCAGQVIIKTNYTKGSGVDTTYTVFASESTIANPNYVFKKDVTGTIYVSPKTYTVTPVAESRAYEADNHNVTVTFTGEGGIEGDSIGMSFTSTQGTISNNNVGSRVVTFTAPTLTGAKAGNYAISVSHIGNLRVQITKATPVVNFPTEATVEYGQKYSAAIFKNDSSSNVNGTFSFVEGNSVANEVIDSYMQARFVPSDSGNYESVTGYVLVRVDKAKLNMNVSFSGTLYSGQTLSAVVSGVTPDALEHVSYAWYRVSDDGAKTFVGEGKTYELTDDDIGYRICLEVIPDPASNYELSEESEENGTFSTTSLKTVVEESLTFWQKFMKWWYRILAAIQSIFDARSR
ncbi:MAG: hypothetical protein IJK23_06875 [Clostridia bacterium]|nr:hypothetical protein [Clostridia bacterium]